MPSPDVTGWLAGYIKAWASNDPDDIGALFTEDALYYTGPFDEPWRGRQEIVASWLARKDTPGTWEFRYEVLIDTVDLAVVQGWTDYRDPVEVYRNLWVIRFAPAGGCCEFTEWWVLKP